MMSKSSTKSTQSPRVESREDGAGLLIEPRLSPEERKELERSPLMNYHVYMDHRQHGDSHKLSIVIALNEWRLMESGMTWSQYRRMNEFANA